MANAAWHEADVDAMTWCWGLALFERVHAGFEATGHAEELA
jgi:hypothetical protein